MSRETLIGMLRQGNNGTQILSILDTITDGMFNTNSIALDACTATSAATSGPTDQPIEF